ncbi:MBL fold metallo-hydrolase [Trujillonella humicola]|uniref:MBL fold metallo-hydrolase n=1 Tax=Trujillonella humicola TaxID=3383699 RepID=UPI003905C0F8
MHPGPRLTHVGGPTLLVELGGWRLLTDPTFDPPGRHYAFGWGTGSRKVRGPALPAAEVLPVDAVLLTHDHHADNLDDAGRALLASVPVVVTTSAGAARLTGGRGGGGPGTPESGPVTRGSGPATRGLRPWQRTVLEAPGRPALEVTATPARHGPPLSRPLVGDVVGFAVRVPAPDAEVLWISGDSVLFDGLRQVADRLRVDIAVLHLGGVRFPVTGPVRYTLSAREAVEVARLVAPRVVVPVHYEGWSHFRQGRAAVERALASAPGEIRGRFRWLVPGTATDLSP